MRRRVVDLLWSEVDEHVCKEAAICTAQARGRDGQQEGWAGEGKGSIGEGGGGGKRVARTEHGHGALQVSLHVLTRCRQCPRPALNPMTRSVYPITLNPNP